MMRVVLVHPDRSLEALGERHDLEPPKRAGDRIVVKASPSRVLHDRGRILPCSIVSAAAPRTRFKLRHLWSEGACETVVEAQAGGPHPRFPPGWRPLPA